MTTGSHLGIDASNLRAGGGLGHIAQVLAEADAPSFGFDQVTVWGGKITLDRISERPWLVKQHRKILDLPLPFRLFWQKIVLPIELRRACCSSFFSPGASLPWKCELPTVIVSQNLLPFDLQEIRRIPKFTFHYWKMRMLRIAQRSAHRRAQGIIFLSRFARDFVIQDLHFTPAKTTVVPHGLERRFFKEPRKALPIESFSKDKPFKILYISTIFFYKHPWNVARAVAQLRDQGFPVELELVGNGIPQAISKLQSTLHAFDPGQRFLHYRGGVPFSEVHRLLSQADVFIFASSCETIASTILEAMAASLPIASSNRGPMPEVLGESAVYFDPENINEMASRISQLMLSPELRDRLSFLAHQSAQAYSWKRSAELTFAFLQSVFGLAKPPQSGY